MRYKKRLYDNFLIAPYPTLDIVLRYDITNHVELAKYYIDELNHKLKKQDMDISEHKNQLIEDIKFESPINLKLALMEIKIAIKMVKKEVLDRKVLRPLFIEKFKIYFDKIFDDIENLKSNFIKRYFSTEFTYQKQKLFNLINITYDFYEKVRSNTKEVLEEILSSRNDIYKSMLLLSKLYVFTELYPKEFKNNILPSINKKRFNLFLELLETKIRMENLFIDKFNILKWNIKKILED